MVYKTARKYFTHQIQILKFNQRVNKKNEYSKYVDTLWLVYAHVFYITC